MVDAIKRSTSLVKKVYTREHHINERVCSTGQIFDRTYRFESCPDYKSFFGGLGNIPYLCVTKRDIL